jgi:hemolysin III
VTPCKHRALLLSASNASYGQQVSTAAITAEPIKPRLRGRIHLAGAVLAIPLAIWLGLQAKGGLYTVGAVTYGVSLVLLLATSGTYHTPQWSEKARDRMQRLDRSMIFVLLGGSYTPFLLAAGGTATRVYLPIIWGLVTVGILRTVFLPNGRRWITTLSYVALGWISAPLMPSWVAAFGWDVLWLIGGGGIIYTLGGVVYAKRTPNPWPETFGYHEVFHVAVILGSACHCWAVWQVVS